VGVDPQYNVGYADSSKNLIKIACEVALGKQPYLPIYGNTYSTKDGTTIRDYIHPTDLALAHFLASDYLIQKQGDNITLNCGYGQGYSVLDVVRAIESVTGKHLNIRFEAKRHGDPIALVADNKKINETFLWQNQFNDIKKIVATSLAWQESDNKH
jgi:UDP-glucose 4-epimerase